MPPRFPPGCRAPQRLFLGYWAPPRFSLLSKAPFLNARTSSRLCFSFTAQYPGLATEICQGFVIAAEVVSILVAELFQSLLGCKNLLWLSWLQGPFSCFGFIMSSTPCPVPVSSLGFCLGLSKTLVRLQNSTNVLLWLHGSVCHWLCIQNNTHSSFKMVQAS